jgi:radical SAM superfamily enzyme YgiQ (UPF0313 family)
MQPDPPPGADLLAISSITCGAPHAYRLAAQARARGTKVVIGGAHATALPDEAARHADAVVVGHGERSWPRLLRDLAAGRLQERYVDFGDPFTGPPVEPDRSQIAGRGYLASSTMEASRGCSNACAFCTVSCLTAGQLHRRPTQDVLHEAAALPGRVVFLDSNFADDLEAVRPLLLGLRAIGKRFYAGVTLRLAEDQAALKLAADCGLAGALIGFESVNESATRGAGKGFNHPDRYVEAVRRLHDHGIRVLGCFAFGLDGDDASVFERTVELADRARIDIVRYAIATPLPGTRLLADLEAQGRITDRDWERYDTEHVVFRPAGMTAQQLHEGYRWAYRQTYRAGSIWRRLAGRNFTPVTLAGNLGFRRIAYTADQGLEE